MEYIKLNKRDMQLVEILSQNSRKNIHEIAKELKVSKQAIHKKMEKIKDKKILKFITLLNYFKLGYNNAHLYFKIQGLKRDEYFKKIDEIKRIKNISWITNLMGDYDLSLSIFFKDVNSLSLTLNKIYEIFGNSIRDQAFHLIQKQFASHVNFEKNKKIVEIGKSGFNEPSNTAKKIIKLIESNSRFEWSQLISELKLNYQTIKKQIKLLEDDGVILGYSTILNYSSMGYSWNICVLNISYGHSQESILARLKSEKNIPFISITVDGNIIFDFVSRNYEELKDFLDSLKIAYPLEIKDYKILNVLSLKKLEYFND
jgi:Lrp/AsnC family transcriptional regulator, leucine-responsive regulatory protein